jgi:DNA-binding response OmpR family regulator
MNALQDEPGRELPALVLLDVNLPDRSGWDVLRESRQRGMDVPSIVVSAVQVGPERLAEFRPLAYLPKPFPIESLLRLVLAQNVCINPPTAQVAITDTTPERDEGPA